MVIKSSIVVIFLFCLIKCYSQGSYSESYTKGEKVGYVILKSGEKVNAPLKVRGKLKNQKKIRFYKETDVHHDFIPSEILAYGFDNVKFVSVDNMFLQTFEEGCLNIYKQFYVTVGVHLYGLFPVVYPYRTFRILKQKKGEAKQNFLMGLSFKNEWSEFLKDDPELSHRILSKELKRKDYREITKMYNSRCKK